MKMDNQLKRRYEYEIEQLHNMVIDEAETKTIAEEYLQYLCQARVALSLDDQVETEYYITLTKSIFARTKKSKELQQACGRRIILYELIWLSVLLILIPIIIFRFGRFIVLGVPGEYYIWGGIGATISAIYNFIKQTSLRDFDRQFITWYYIKPMLGIITGAVVYFLFMCIIFAMGVEIDPIRPNLLILLACCLTGFSEKFSLEMVESASRSIFNIPSRVKKGKHREVDSRE